MSSNLKFLKLICLLIAVVRVHAGPVVGHELDVLVDPQHGSLSVRDRVDLPPGAGPWAFLLHGDLEPRVADGDARLTRIGAEGHLDRFRLDAAAPGPVTLQYRGRIRHELENLREGMGRARQWTRGIISEDGVVLDGFSGWYPRFEGGLQRFDLRVGLPRDWIAVSQGAGPEVEPTGDGVSVRWRESQPQDDIYLIAAPFARYARNTRFGEAQAYLRRPDAELAERYLVATERYLELYSRIIGPYPYAKFALVENFWETGYGMPSFTLLGPRVIRLPFIVHTSYPHEVLHNWWGNGVYVDYESGNWSEGLTAYLADHLLREQRGDGADYRRDSLKSYADYVREANDFPLRDFRGRHGSASQAIGYGKTLMVFHMLRRDLGDDAFVASLRRFFRDNLFRDAGFAELRAAFEQESGRDLEEYFDRWTGRTGAPTLALSDVRKQRTDDGHLLRGRLAQTQAEPPFPIQVPLAVHLEGGGLFEHRVPLDGRSANFELKLPAAPLRVDADPRFDLFRSLVPGESPPTLSALFGAENGLILLPTAENRELASQYRGLAEAWREGSRGWEIATDAEIRVLPEDRPVWLLGWSNRLLRELKRDQRRFGLDEERRLLSLPAGDYPGVDFSLALVDLVEGRPVGWVASSDPAALAGLARKLPHYGKYSYLAFAGEAPTNRLKGRWPVKDSSLMVWLTNRRPTLSVPPKPPLTAVLD